jgi:hypothetical protein
MLYCLERPDILCALSLCPGNSGACLTCCFWLSLTLLHFILQVRVVSRVPLLLSAPLHSAISSNYKYTASLCPTSRIVSKTCYLVLCCYAREAWYVSHLLLLALHVFNFPPSLCLVQSSSMHSTPYRVFTSSPPRQSTNSPVHQFTSSPRALTRPTRRHGAYASRWSA